RRSPVLMSVTPYGKDALPDRLGMMLMRLSGVRFGRQRQPVQPDEVVPVEIEVLACSTYFEAGTSLRVEVLGHDAARYPAFKHGRSVNRGTQSIQTGGRYPSALLTPFVNR